MKRASRCRARTAERSSFSAARPIHGFPRSFEAEAPMGASFFEVMRGQLAASGHGMNPVDVEIKVEATHLRQLLRTGKARVTGVVHAPPWAELAAAEGEI